MKLHWTIGKVSLSPSGRKLKIAEACPFFLQNTALRAGNVGAGTLQHRPAVVPRHVHLRHLRLVHSADNPFLFYPYLPTDHLDTFPPGMSFFMNVKHRGTLDNVYNFETFGKSMILLFQVEMHFITIFVFLSVQCDLSGLGLHLICTYLGRCKPDTIGMTFGQHGGISKVKIDKIRSAGTPCISFSIL